ncbi:Gfo/Idh/MocA family oxidoreductase [Saccharopolyspora sp. HNM0983]|uniref:Gfo/Idh/MocA family oxidoreductase n=1 Tax=Saccharopolyspora montiporae TaxID=2781240 RepID=A0A929B8V3_9PSEU|nr:Gfo/Idh/MocA family oxidoreductase [Saccharopolyspora sp. HNM0983]MBE9373693.1 Gfo/Idh/MocA family oxidoreductase [Saccharopolyspora sp. HNM0983]
MAGTGSRRIGVIGLGAIARYYLAAIEELPQWRLGAVCDLRDHAAPQVADVPRYRDHRRMLREADLDAVVVTVPNDAHAPVCIDALTAGIPVCVEKPLALTPEQARGVLAAAGGSGVLFTAFHRRSNDHVRALLREASRRGEVHEVRVRYLERIEEHTGGEDWYLDPARCGGGCLADNGPNAFDLVRMFAGEVQVRAASVTRDERGTDRQAVVYLDSATGISAEVQLDWSYPGERKDVRLRFADGTSTAADLLAGFDGFKSSLWHEYRGILQDFRDAIDGGHQDGGLAALELVAAAYAAASQDGTSEDVASEDAGRAGTRVPGKERAS